MRAIYLAGGPDDGKIMTAEHLSSLTVPAGYIDPAFQSSAQAEPTWQDANFAIFVHNTIEPGIPRQTASAVGRVELFKALPHLR